MDLSDFRLRNLLIKRSDQFTQSDSARCRLVFFHAHGELVTDGHRQFFHLGRERVLLSSESLALQDASLDVKF